MAPSRREFLGTVAGAVALSAVGRPRPARAAGPVRNLLLVSIDDLNDWVGALGAHPGAQTPHIDRLMAGALSFTRAYTASPACMPSRASLVTGVHTVTHRVQDNYPYSQVEALEAVPWLTQWPAHFKANGWRLLGAGKIYHGGNQHVFDDYFKPDSDPEPPVLPANGIPGADGFDWGPMDVPVGAMHDAQVASWISDRLTEPQDAPFVLGCGFRKPHLPWFAPQKFFDRHPLDEVVLPAVLDDDLEDIPRAGQRIAAPDGTHATVVETDNWRSAVQAYLACVTFVDAQVGRVLDALEAGPHADSTAVVLWSDHGWHLGEKLHWRKFALWEEATRVPFAVRVPGLTTPGALCERTVSALDIYPTLLSLFGLPPVEPLDGHDLTPLLSDPAAPWPHPAVMVLDEAHVSVRSERWRYIRYDDGTEELYDHEADPEEWTNRAGDPALDAVKADLARHLPVRHFEGETATEPPPDTAAEPRTYPFPSRGLVTLDFLLPTASALTLTVVDMTGRVVDERPLGDFAAGRHRVTWAGADAGLPSGSYVCRVHGPGYAGTHRVLLLR